MIIMVQVKLTLLNSPRNINAIPSTIFKNTRGVFLLFDLTQFGSITNLLDYAKLILNKSETPPIIFLIGNKKDLADKRQVPDTVVAELQNRMTQELSTDIPYFEISVKTGENVGLIIEAISQKIIANQLIDTSGAEPFKNIITGHRILHDALVINFK